MLIKHSTCSPDTLTVYDMVDDGQQHNEYADYCVILESRTIVDSGNIADSGIGDSVDIVAVIRIPVSCGLVAFTIKEKYLGS